jgi:hypothetical protein
MRAPDKPEGKKNEETISPALSFFLIASLVLSLLFYSMSPVLAVDNGKKLSVVLIDGGEIYVRSGNYHNFSQDYQLYVKGADSDGKRVWLELRREGVSLKDDIATEGSQFVYSNDSTEILNLTVGTIYAGADGVLVRFSPVYQYLDPKLPMPQTLNGSLPNSSDNESSETQGLETQAEGFNVPIFLLGLGAVFLVIGFFARKRTK